MKKWLTIAAVLLAVLMCAVLLFPSRPPQPTKPPATGSQISTQPTGNQTGTNSTNSTGTTPVVTPPPTTIVTTPTGTIVVTLPPPTTIPPEPGVVRFYTCDAQRLETYQALADAYAAATGTQVQILTPQEGQTCQDALTALLASESAPTMLCVHSKQMLEQLQHQLLDLTGTQVAQELYGPALAQGVDGKLLALAVDVGGSGLIYNADKLATFGFTDADILDFSYLRDVVLPNIKTLKGYAFAAMDFTNEHLMEHLSGLYPDTNQLRAFLDMYIHNSTQKTTMLEYFLKGTTVFYLGGTADFDDVSAIGVNNLRFLPAYSENTAVVQCFSDHYWAVNAASRSADIQATLDFWTWLVTGENGAPIDELGMLSPYHQARHADHILQQKLREYISGGNVYLTWSVAGDVTDLEAFTAAVQAYTKTPNDETWAAVAAQFAQ